MDHKFCIDKLKKSKLFEVKQQTETVYGNVGECQAMCLRCKPTSNFGICNVLEQCVSILLQITIDDAHSQSTSLQTALKAELSSTSVRRYASAFTLIKTKNQKKANSVRSSVSRLVRFWRTIWSLRQRFHT